MNVQGSLDAMLTLPNTFPPVNSSDVSANGYCFGGLMVLELARFGGAEVRAVTSFHGEVTISIVSTPRIWPHFPTAATFERATPQRSSVT
jgi:dienelactone hydrolase